MDSSKTKPQWRRRPFGQPAFDGKFSNSISSAGSFSRRRKEKPKTARHAKVAVDEKISFFHTLLIEGMRNWKMSREERRKLRLLMGTRPIGPRPLLSDMKARRQAAYILIGLMARHWKYRPLAPERNYYFLTFIDNMGNTLDRNPEVNLGALRRKIDKAMRSMGLHGVVMIEVQALMNYPGQGHGRTLMYHAHAIAWTDKPFDAFKHGTRINRSRSWNNAFEAAPVKITEMTKQPGEIEWLAHYIAKVPHDAKNRMPNQKHPGKYLLMQTRAGYRPELAVRVFEGLSQIELPDVLFGVGEGSLVRDAWRRKLLAWHHRRISGTLPITPPFDVAEYWRNLRARNGSKHFAPYRFLAGSQRPASVHFQFGQTKGSGKAVQSVVRASDKS
jgi:hypothetical protein